MANLAVHLFGGIDISLDGERVTGFRSDKVRALLVYLILEAGRAPVRRATLIDLLWEGYAPESAAHNLRTALHDLRNLFGAFGLLQADRQVVWLDTSRTDLFCDVLRFESLLGGVSTAAAFTALGTAVPVSSLREAQAVYRGEFMAGFRLPDCPRFAAWQEAQRQKYAARAQMLADVTQRYAPARGNIPRQLTPFLGRTAELELLARKALDSSYPLITVVGQGGVGKTRLACMLAERIREHFSDGVWFVPLVDIAPSMAAAGTAEHVLLTESLASTIGAALAATFRSGPALSEQLFEYLRPRCLFLILDNFEHLASARTFVVELLRRAPQVVVLITSRHRLDLQAEYVLPLEGLPVPDPGATWPPKSGPRTSKVQIDDYSSISLFRERAERTGSVFKLDASNQRDVVRICRLLEGLPLAIELAANLTAHQGVAEVAAGIAASYDLLTTTLQDVPVRQRSLRAVFDHSWRLLTEGEAAALARCSVFQGSFTPEAALAVSGVSPATLAALVAKSLLYRTATDRYSMHLLVRQFAAEKLALDQPTCVAVFDRHCTFGLDWLAKINEHTGDDPGVYRAALADLDNLRAAWSRAVSELRPATLGIAARGLALLYHHYGLLQEADQVFGQAAERLRATPGADCEDALGRVLLERSYFAERLGRPDEAAEMAREALDLGERTDSAYLRAGGHLRLAGILWGMGRYPAAYTLSERGLALARLAGDQRLVIVGLEGLALDLNRRGAHAQAIALHEAALDLAHVQRQRRLAGIVAANLGLMWATQGDFERATLCFMQALTIQRQIEDRVGVAMTQIELGRIALMLGDSADAQGQLTAALTVLEETGERFHRCEALTTAALLWLRQGDFVHGLETSQQAVEFAQAAQAHGALSEALLVQGHILAGLGRTADARACYVQTIELVTELQDEVLDAPARAGLADLSLSAGELTDALTAVEPLLPVLPALQLNIFSDPFRVYLTCHRVLAAAGDARAREVARAAQIRLRDLADRIMDPAVRWRFLEQVPSNRNVMLLKT